MVRTQHVAKSTAALRCTPGVRLDLASSGSTGVNSVVGTVALGTGVDGNNGTMSRATCPQASCRCGPLVNRRVRDNIATIMEVGLFNHGLKVEFYQ